MKKQNLVILGGMCVIVMTMLACGLTGADDEAPAPTPRSSTLLQWASSASASSEYGEDSWSAAQVLGSPDTTECGDFTTAWASYYYDGVDWLDVGFETPVVPTQVNIYQTYNPGSIVKVELRDESGSFHTVYESTPSAVETCPRTLTIDITGIDFKVNAVLISVDQSVLMNWNEIDAVQLVGKP